MEERILMTLTDFNLLVKLKVPIEEQVKRYITIIDLNFN